MARQQPAKAGPFKCEKAGCTATFIRARDRQRHMTEKHGPRTYCRVRNCKWSVKRKALLRSHLDGKHPDEAWQACLLFVLSDLPPPGTPQLQPLAANSTSTERPTSPDPLPSTSTTNASASASSGPVPQCQRIQPDTPDALILASTLPPPRLSYPRASRSPRNAQRRVYRDLRVRRRPVSEVRRSTRYDREQEVLPRHQVDEEVSEIATSLRAFGMELELDFDVGLDLDMEEDVDGDVEDDAN